MSADTVQLAIGDESVALLHEDLDRLFQALVGLDRSEAASVADDIGALRLAGGAIRLLPTEAELAVVRVALSAADDLQPLSDGLLRLCELCDPDPAPAEERP